VSENIHLKEIFIILINVDVLVDAVGILSCTTFIREKEDSISQRKTIEQLKNTPENNKVK
jgi:hypothetical protein